jgi:hypothetical protein
MDDTVGLRRGRLWSEGGVEAKVRQARRCSSTSAWGLSSFDAEQQLIDVSAGREDHRQRRRTTRRDRAASILQAFPRRGTFPYEFE